MPGGGDFVSFLTWGPEFCTRLKSCSRGRDFDEKISGPVANPGGW